MASPYISVFVKTLSGEVLAVEVDPSLGLKGVAHALAAHSPEEFPSATTRVIHVDDSTTLSSESILAVVQESSPICQLLFKKEITLPATKHFCEASYHVWAFRLAMGNIAIVYLRMNAPRPEFNILVDEYLIGATMFGAFTIEDSLHRNADQIPLHDAHIISAVIHKLMPSGYPREDVFRHKERSFFCECGHIVQGAKLKQHLATKRKHPLGDEDGKAFLYRAQQYIDTL